MGDHPGAARLRPSAWEPSGAHLRTLAKAVEDRLARLLSRPGIEVVDIGCGGGPYRALFEARGARVTGVDIQPGPGVDVVARPGEALPLPGGCADLVVSFQVLEHVENPAAFVRECGRLLRPGGALLLTTHGNYPFHPDPIDLHRWTGEGLRRLASGLEVEEIAGIGEGLFTPVALANVLLGHRLRGLRGLQAVLAAPLWLCVPLLNGIALLLDRPGRPEECPLGLLLVARRPAEGRAS